VNRAASGAPRGRRHSSWLQQPAHHAVENAEKAAPSTVSSAWPGSTAQVASAATAAAAHQIESNRRRFMGCVHCTARSPRPSAVIEIVQRDCNRLPGRHRDGAPAKSLHIIAWVRVGAWRSTESRCRPGKAIAIALNISITADGAGESRGTVNAPHEPAPVTFDLVRRRGCAGRSNLGSRPGPALLTVDELPSPHSPTGVMGRLLEQEDGAVRVELRMPLDSLVTGTRARPGACLATASCSSIWWERAPRRMGRSSWRGAHHPGASPSRSGSRWC